MHASKTLKRVALWASALFVLGCSDRDASLVVAAGTSAVEAGTTGQRAVPTAPAPAGSGQAAKAGPAAPERDPSLVTATPGVARYLSTGLPGEVVVRDELKIPGRLETNENRTARIGAPTTGRLTAIHATVGQKVRQGDVLAEISSPELSSAQLGFLKAHSAEQLAQRAVDRARLLLEAGVIGAAELQRRESELSVARAEKQAARDQLRVLGLPLRAIDRLMQTGQIITAAPITATKAGTVIERRAALGQVVAPSDELFTVTNLAALWAVADVPEQDARQARIGQRVELQVPALGEQRTEGTISWVSDLVDPQTRTIRVRMELPNPEGELKPAMLATMLIKGPERRRLVVPRAALVRDENRDFVFVAESADSYRMRAVTLGAETGDTRVVLEGLRAGERIVTSGAFHLNNERRQLAVGGR